MALAVQQGQRSRVGTDEIGVAVEVVGKLNVCSPNTVVPTLWSRDFLFRRSPARLLSWVQLIAGVVASRVHPSSG